MTRRQQIDAALRRWLLGHVERRLAQLAREQDELEAFRAQLAAATDEAPVVEMNSDADSQGVNNGDDI